MKERKAIYYGKVELIPGIICDGYVLDDGCSSYEFTWDCKTGAVLHIPCK